MLEHKAMHGYTWTSTENYHFTARGYKPAASGCVVIHTGINCENENPTWKWGKSSKKNQRVFHRIKRSTIPVYICDEGTPPLTGGVAVTYTVMGLFTVEYMIAG